MTLFRRLSDSAPIISNQPSIPEETTSQPQQNNLGAAYFEVAGNSDVFEAASPNNSNFVNQTNEYVEMKLPSSPELTVDASAIFAQFEGVLPELDNVTPPKPDPLQPLREKRDELVAQLTALEEKIQGAQTALSKMIKALESDQPIPPEVQSILSTLGLVGILAGLPGIPIIGGLLGMFGLSEDYKQKMKKAIGELTRQLGELEVQSEELTNQLDEVNGEMEKIEQERKEKIAKDLEETQRQYQTELPHKNVIKDFAFWRTPISLEDVIQKEDTPFVATFYPTSTEDD